MTTTLLVLSTAAGAFVVPLPAGAADTPPEPIVTVKADGFVSPWGGSTVYARPKQLIRFVLAQGVDTHRTVTLEAADCRGSLSQCEQRFDNPNDRSHGVEYSFSQEGDYHFFDRYAREENRGNFTGVMVVTNAPPVPPSTTTTTLGPSTTTTTSPATTTTTAPTTTTTEPTSIHPFLIPDPTTTTTTTMATTAPPPPTTAPGNKDKEKDKGKKAASPSTPTTAAPAPPDAMPPDSVFDPAALTPGPTLLPAPDGSNAEDEAAIDASAAASLLDAHKAGDDGSKLLLMALGALAMLLLVGGAWAWFTRASQYDPA